MKKKLISLLLVGVMVFSNAAMVSANDSHDYEVKESTKKSGAEALAALDDGTGVIIDVRAKERQEDYSIKGSISLPLFTVENGSNKAIDLQDGVDENGLEGAFNAYVEDAANKATLSTKDIYVLCNSGATGAKNATTLLFAAGYDLNKVFTIENGAKSLDILDRAIGNDWTNEGTSLDLNRKTGAEAVAAVDNSNVVILDVRATEVREMNGHLKNSVSQPVFHRVDGSNKVVDVFNAEDDLVKAFKAYAADNKTALAGKDIYILCNGGQSGARAAMKLLLNAGYSFDNLYVVTSGASDADVKAALTYDYNYATGAEALADENGIIIDVRNEKNHNNYSLADSTWVPLFDENNNISTDSDLAKAFTEFAKSEEGQSMIGKNIYILCNSGKRGAETATKLLMQTGLYDLANIHTITNGAKDLAILDKAIGNDWTNEGTSLDLNRKTGAEAVAAVDNSNVVILDVRAAEVREMNGHLKNSVSQPVFHRVSGSNKVVDVFNAEDDLVKAFKSYAADNKTALAGKDIYILCNGGQSGARAAMKLLLNAGYSFDNLYVVTGGASDADVKAALTYDYNYATGEEALADENGIIIDVRNEKNHNNYSLADSTWVPLFDENNKISTDSDLAKAFTEFAKSEEGQSMIGKNIYILCNSGKRGAETATKLLMQTGLYDLDNIYTITNGAKDLDILDEAIGNGGDSWNNGYQNFVSGKDAVAALNNKDVVILDVRATAVREANGELKGSVAQPLFNHVNGKNVVTTLKDDLATNFTNFVKGNKDLAGKQIYILCNGGQSGARAALKLLINAGYSYDNIHVIKGGAGDADVKAALVPVNVTGTVQTGDSATFIPYILMMGAALAAVVVTSKKKFVK